MRVEFLTFLSRWGEPLDQAAVPEGHFHRYGDVLPAPLLDFWREVGFAGFGDGLLWSCDPDIWQPVVDLWVSGLDLPEPYAGGQIPIFRTAYGEVYCFKPGVGQKLAITPAISRVDLLRLIPVPGQKWIDFDILNVLDRPPRLYLQRADHLPVPQPDMFGMIADRLGRTTPDTIYSFDPPTQQGGRLRAEYAVLVEAIPELTRLHPLKPVKIGRN